MVATDNASIGRMRDIAGALAIAQHVLLGDPDQLRAQVAGRIGGAPSVTPRRPDAVRLVPEETSLAAPGGPLGITLVGHIGAVTAVASFPDARRIASAGADRTVRIWDLRRGTAITVIHVPDDFGRPESIAVSTDGMFLAVVGGRHLGVWHAQTHEMEALWDAGSDLLDVAWLPEGRLVTGSAGGEVTFWRLGTERPVRTKKGHNGPVRAVGVTPDGRRAVSASTDKTLRVWDAARGSALATLTAPWEQYAVDLAPDGRHVVTGSDTVPLLWDLDGDATPTILTTFYGPEHDMTVDAVTVTMDGALIVSAAGPDMKIWQTNREYPAAASGTLVGHASSVTDLATLPDGQMIASASLDGTIRLWQLDPASQRPVSTPSSDPVEWLGFGTDGNVIGATVRYDDTDDGAEWESVLRWSGGSIRWYYRIYSIARSSNGRRIAVAVGNNIRVLDVASGIVREVGYQSFARLAVEPDGRRAASISLRGSSVRIWDLDRETEPTVLETGGPETTTVAWSSDGTCVASGLANGVVRLWRSDAPDPGRNVPVCDGPVTRLAAAGVDRFVVLDGDGAFFLVDGDGAACIGDLPGGTDLVVSLDRRRLAVIGSEEVAVWDVEDGRRLASIPGPNLRTSGVFQCGIRGNPLPTLSLAADVPWAAACHEATVTVWNLESGEPMASFTADGVIEACSFDDLATRVAVGTVSGDTHILGLE